MKLWRKLFADARRVEQEALEHFEPGGELAFPAEEDERVVLAYVRPLYPNSVFILASAAPYVPAAEGVTTRLTRCCTSCGDELPDDAVFCVTCGHAVANMVFE